MSDSVTKRGVCGRKFIHPGILHTEDDLNRMKDGVAKKRDPWYPAFLNMSQDPLASSSYIMKGPLTFVTRNGTGGSPGKTQLSSDGVAAMLNALMFYITGDSAHAAKSAEILSSWANTLQLLNGTDAQLTAGLYGPQFVNAAEIIREYYHAWNQSEIAVFKKMILDIFYPPASQTTPSPTQKYPFLANWGSAGEKALVQFGVFLDNETMYNEGLSLYRNFACANLNGTINSFGQSSESGRDQGHTQLGLGNMAELCQTASNQGDAQYWDLLEDRLLVGYEYTAKYNLGNDVPYDPGFYRCGANLVGGPWAQISNISRGQFRPMYEIAYGHFAQLQGKSMPFTREILESVPLETQDSKNNIGDSEVYGTLRFRRLRGNITATSSN
ncbi:chondroitin AC/alginate lyase [Lipomyces doorenjongii]|uniref:chondroitin AC/alginate lyase n=1 Tax=Lipomyces doorenjongii TaxID=383834 RepID=UPI0034CE8E0D